ncbi:MAG: hypothetical protein CMJ19_14420 [Phycisphaeraceae bacterium]|nr:hypothetical protein [Phycisphaeraceae bacterium]
MKIWYQHGSEHSANIVMIGQFVDDTSATKAKEIIDILTKQVLEESDGIQPTGLSAGRYSNEMLDLLGKLNIMSLGPQELEQFTYDVKVEEKGSKIVVTTDEIEISAFLKVLLDQGACIEVFSAHDHPDREHAR